MAEGSEPSFGRLVFNRAWFGAWGFFDSWQKDTILAVVSLAVGEASYYRQHGMPATMLDGVYNALHLIAPLALVWAVLFVWHFWLAPSALAYEAAKQHACLSSESDASSVIRLPSDPPINWAIWRQRSSYTIIELSKILAKTDPARMDSNPEATGFLALIKDDGMNGKLPLIRDRLARGYEQPDIYPEYFAANKAAALKWATEKGFDLSHIA